MPGPGGGSRGGGFSGGSRGGGFSGGSRGGGFSGGSRGPMHHGPHHHHHGPIFFGPRFGRRYYGGGGCLGSMIGSIIFIIVFIAIMGLAIFAMIFGETDVNSGIIYQEQALQTYANDQYYSIFANTENYEENILLVYTVYEGYDGYEAITWIGDDVPKDINLMFTGQAISKYIADYYEFQLPRAISMAVEDLADKIPQTSGSIETGYSKLVNNSSLAMNKDTVNDALVAFTEKTGYNISVVVVDGETVFGNTNADNEDDLAFVGFLVVLAIIVVIIIVSSKKKSAPAGGPKGSSDKTDPDAGQGKYDPNTGEWK